MFRVWSFEKKLLSFIFNFWEMQKKDYLKAFSERSHLSRKKDKNKQVNSHRVWTNWTMRIRERKKKYLMIHLHFVRSIVWLNSTIRLWSMRNSNQISNFQNWKQGIFEYRRIFIKFDRTKIKDSGSEL
jgi:hypothetical protein